jgi:hypothetical protein
MLSRSRSRTLHIYLLLLHWEYTKTCLFIDLKMFTPTLEENTKIFVRNKCSEFFVIVFSSNSKCKREVCGYAKIKYKKNGQVSK